MPPTKPIKPSVQTIPKPHISQQTHLKKNHHWSYQWSHQRSHTQHPNPEEPLSNNREKPTNLHTTTPNPPPDPQLQTHHLTHDPHSPPIQTHTTTIFVDPKSSLHLQPSPRRDHVMTTSIAMSWPFQIQPSSGTSFDERERCERGSEEGGALWERGNDRQKWEKTKGQNQ